MKEDLVKYIMQHANGYYSDDFPINKIAEWIDEFFDKYEKCELGHDFFTIPLSDQRYCRICGDDYDPKIHGE